LALGLSIRDNVEMELALETPSAAMATELLKTANEAEVTQPEQFRGLLRSFTDGNTAHFRMTIPNELAMEAMRLRTAPALVANSSPQPQPAPVKPRRSTITIQGLEEGPREIPLH
jgi:hypothetical protein